MPQHTRPRPQPIGSEPIVWVLLALVLATIGSFGIGFGIGTACTTDLDVGSMKTGPCHRVEQAMIANACGQLVVVAATVRAHRQRPRPRLVRTLGASGLAWIAF